MSRVLVALFAALGLAAALGAIASPASAHEVRVVGKYKLTVGWAAEPAFVNVPNALFLQIRDAQTEQGVEGLDETLQAQIIVGGGAQTRDLPLEPSDEQPGLYLGSIVPTLVGDYSFRISGTIEGQAIDETFSSGPETFDPVEDIAELQFPPTPPSKAGSDSGSDDTSLILAIVAIATGGVGIAVGVIALATRRSR